MREMLDEEGGWEEGEVEEGILVDAGDGVDVVVVVVMIDAGDEVDVVVVVVMVACWGKVPSCVVSSWDKACSVGKRGGGETWGGPCREVRLAPGSLSCVKARGSGEGISTELFM